MRAETEEKSAWNQLQQSLEQEVIQFNPVFQEAIQFKPVF